MRSARLIVHGELGDHLPRPGGPDLRVGFELPCGLRDLVQAAGIPHVEVGRLEVDGTPSPWPARIDDGATVELWARYPLRAPEPDPRFILDVHLGKLARLLRLLGFDAGHDPDAEDARLATVSASEGRILLTRDRALLMRGVLKRGRWIRATDPVQQAVETVVAFHVAGMTAPFRRCLECNGDLEPAEPSPEEVPAGVLRRHRTFSRCVRCRRLYWPGSHHDRMSETVERIREAVESVSRPDGR